MKCSQGTANNNGPNPQPLILTSVIMRPSPTCKHRPNFTTKQSSTTSNVSICLSRNISFLGTVFIFLKRRIANTVLGIINEPGRPTSFWVRASHIICGWVWPPLNSLLPPTPSILGQVQLDFFYGNHGRQIHTA